MERQAQERSVCKTAKSNSSDFSSIMTENKYSRVDSLKQATLTQINIYMLKVSPFPRLKQQKEISYKSSKDKYEVFDIQY